MSENTEKFYFKTHSVELPQPTRRSHVNAIRHLAIVLGISTALARKVAHEKRHRLKGQGCIVLRGSAQL